MKSSIDPSIQLSRIRGTLFGGALGDAIGLYTEFMNKVQISLRYEGLVPRFSLARPAPLGFHSCFQDRHRAVFEWSGWTDDTDQTLLILLSFLRSGGKEIDELDFAKRLRRWIANGLRALDRLPLGVGKTMGGVVGGEGYLEDPVGAATKYWEKTNRFVAPNGAVMRTAIIGCLLFQDTSEENGMERTMKAAIRVAATTHADPRCLVSCAIVSGLVAGIMRGEIKSEASIQPIIDASKQLLLSHCHPISQEHLQELDQFLNVTTLDDLRLDHESTIGYTYKTLGCGVWALKQAIATKPTDPDVARELFENLITELTLEGGDADTNCAVAGSLVGCYLTYDGLPRHWLAHLTHSNWLMEKSDATADILSIRPPPPRNLRATPKNALNPPPTYSEATPYVFETDQDTLIDAGKGDMTKEELDERWKKLIEQMHWRLGDIQGKRMDGCITL